MSVSKDNPSAVRISARGLRFLGDDEFSELYDAKTTELTELLFTNGIAADLIDTWTQLLVDGAPGLVSEATVESDASALTAYVARVS